METPIEEEVEREGEEGEKRKWTILPYVKDTTERISRILSKQDQDDIQTSKKNRTTAT